MTPAKSKLEDRRRKCLVAYLNNLAVAVEDGKATVEIDASNKDKTVLTVRRISLASKK